MIRTAIYMRVSTDRQAQEGDSIPAQRDALRKYIDNHDDMIFAGEYLDDGISGTKNDRDEFQRLLSDVKAHKIDMILVTKMDRLHRSLRNFLNMQDVLDKNGCNWLAICEPMYDTSTPQGRMIISTMMNLAQFEAEQTGQRIRQVFDYKIANGEVTNGKQPVGFSIVNKRLIPNEDADTIREVFDYYSKCGNINDTMRKFGGTHSLPTSKGSFRNVLSCTKYIGEFKGNKAFCEPIIDKDLFYDVQRQLAMNVKKSQKNTYIFSGLLRCAECGSSLGGMIYKRQNKHSVKVYKRYRCNHHYSSIAKCENSHHAYEISIERYLLSNVRMHLADIVYVAETELQIVKNNSDKVAAVNRKIERLKDLYINELISLDEYKRDKERFENEKDALLSQRAPECRDMSGLKELLSQPFETLYADFTDEQKRRFWRSIIREIVVIDGKTFKPYYL